MLTIPDIHIFRRWCWRRLRVAAMVVFPQKVSYYGAMEHGDRGWAQCTACGKEHLILGGHGEL